ncbi:glycosyltransferase [Rickettsiella endosymbiont of Aleochara curtula]|uniref:glycosyltransferase n=1 Tax=Rickettsiella endosymbiont of Aleochara curtula TaxID=3077936 RepID=UPI00313B8149
MKIVIDLQAAQSVSRLHGIGRYSLSFTKALAKNAGRHEIWLALNSCFPDSIQELRNNFKDLIDHEHIKIFYTNQPTAEYLNNSSNIKISKKLREHFLNTLSPDIIHISSLFEGWVDGAVTSIGELGNRSLTTVTLYDLIPLIREKEYLKDINISKFYYKKLQNLKRADLLFSISPSARQDAIDMLSISSDKIINCSAGISNEFCQYKVSDKDRFELMKLYPINRQFILYVGGFDHRKNIEKLIEAFSILPHKLRKLHQLVIVGRVIESTKQYVELLKNRYNLTDDELIITDYISDNLLINLYNLCKLFILPSLHEGFGLPLLEALACGAAAIASNVPSLSELINCKDALFDPTQTNSIKEKMIIALTNEPFRQFLKVNGKEQAQKFTWDACAKKALIAFEELKKGKQTKFYGRCYTKNKMAFISPIPPEKTGVANYSLQLLPELARCFDIVIIVDKVLTENMWLIANFPMHDAQWFTENSDKFDIILYQFGNSPFHYYMFKLFESNPGIVVLHDFFLSGVLHWADAMLSHERNTFYKILYESHGYSSLLYHKEKGREAALETYPCNIHIIKNAYGIIVHSQHAIDLANKWYNLNNPCYTQKISQLALKTHSIQRTHARKNLQLTDNDFLICSFGFVTPNKLSHRICLSLINSNFFKNLNVYLAFVGENHLGDYGTEMNEIIEKNNPKKINITNFISTELFGTYLSAADIAIQLRAQSRGETSACIFSCLYFGIPTIVNTHGSLSELPEDIVYKLNENFTDAELVTAVKTLYENQSLRYQLSQNALEYLKKHHPSSVANEYKKVINHFINHNPNYMEKHLINDLAENNHFELEATNLLSTVTTIASNRLPLGLNQILVDISILINSDEKTGIQRVVRAILVSLLHNPPRSFRIEPVYFKNTGQYFYARRYITDILGLEKNILEDSILEINSGDIFLGLDFCPTTIPQSKAILQDWRIKGVKLYFILYDLLPILRSEFFPNQTKPTFLLWLEAITALSDNVICISKHVAIEYTAWIQSTNSFKKPKVDFFHLGSNVEASLPSLGHFEDNLLLQTIFSKLSFLTVGRIEPRKGHTQILNAFNKLWLNGLDLYLVIVGQQGWMVEQLINGILNHPEYGKRLIWLNNVSDEILKDLYLASTALILASEDEGFGLPLIEAAQHGLNIIARDIPIFREIAGNHVFYFKGSDPLKLAHSIEKWLTLRSQNMEPKIKDMKYLSWKESTQQLLEIIITNKKTYNQQNEFSILLSQEV